jgi:hypothetical protein
MNNEISSLAKRVGYQPGDMNLFFIRMKMISKRNQLPRQNFYSSKKCIYSKSISDCKLYNSDEPSICPYYDKIRAEQSTKNYERRKLYERQRLPPYAIRRNKERKP